MSDETQDPGDLADPTGDSPLEPDTTFELLQRFRAGDREALERLYARYVVPLRRWASGRLPQWARDIADTEDLVQETLLQTFNRIEAFEPEGRGAFHAYLRQAVLNRIRDEIRRAARQPLRRRLEKEPVDPAASPLEEAVGSEALDRYERALARLKPAEREAVIARVDLGLSYDELAAALGKPTAEAARKAAQRALVRLAEEMSGED